MGREVTGARADSAHARRAVLTQALNQARFSIEELRRALRAINDPEIRDELLPILEASESAITSHAIRTLPTVADDVANLRSFLTRVDVAREDPILGPLPNLAVLRGARGNLLADLDEILNAAQEFGLRPGNSDVLPSGVQLERTGREGKLRALSNRLTEVERHIAEKILPEGLHERDRSRQQTSLVNGFASALNIQIILARLELASKRYIDLTNIGRAVEQIGAITRDFIATVQGLGDKATATLLKEAKALGAFVSRVLKGARTLLGSAQRTALSASPPAPPALFDKQKARTWILHGKPLPTEWSSRIFHLNFGANSSIRDLRSLSSLTELRYLYLRFTEVTDLSPLRGLKALETLDLGHTPVKDVSPLGTLEALEFLDLTQTNVIDISSFRHLRALRSLLLPNTDVVDIRCLTELMRLEKVDLRRTKVTDISPLARHEAIKKLYLARTKVHDVAALATSKSLELIDLSSTGVSDVTPLAELSNLQAIDLRGTKVMDVSALAGLPNLKAIGATNQGHRDHLAETLGANAGIVCVPELFHWRYSYLPI